MSGIEENLANKLNAAGITVKGEILPNSNACVEDDDSRDSEDSDNECLQIKNENRWVISCILYT